MANIYIGQMKDTIKHYLKNAQAIKQELETNESMYGGEYLDTKNKEVQEKAEKFYINAKKTINDIFEQTRNLLAIANFPNVEELTADRLLFCEETKIDLTASEVKAFVERYAGNFTMLRLIKSWIKRNHPGMTEYVTAEKSINMPIDHLGVYKKFAVSALSHIDSIRQKTDNFSDLMLNAYADENTCANLFAIIGDGMDLGNFSTRKVPESAKHCFDNITLNLDLTSNFQGAVPLVFANYKTVR